MSMKRSIRLAVLGLGAVAALIAAAVAFAAYTSPTLRVSYAGTTTNITASASQNDDATAAVTIYVPTGTTVTATQAPGTQIGTVKAQVQALALGGALLPLDGKIIVAPPGAIPPESQAACTRGATPTAAWLLVLTAAGQTINLPAYIIPTSGPEAAIGPAKLAFCLPPPDLPVDKGGATFGAKFLSAALSVQGVFSPVPQGAWISTWTPWQAGNGQVNPGATVVAPAGVANGSVTVKAKKVGAGALVSGLVKQGPLPRPGAVVQIWGAKGKAAFRRLGVVKSDAKGLFVFKAKSGDVFQARASAPPTSAPQVCQLLQPLLTGLGGIPCVNPTANGFSVKSAAVNKK
jgi:hypothetical protein